MTHLKSQSSAVLENQLMAMHELDELRKQLEALQKSHDTLLKSSSISNGTFGPPDVGQLHRSATRLGDNAVFADTSTLSDDSSDDEDDFFVRAELPSQTFDHEHLREHLRTRNWTEHGREILASIVSDPAKLSKQPHLFHLGLDPADDRSHYSHFQVYNVGGTGLPELIEASESENGMSKATEIWHAIRDVSKNKNQPVVGRITIAGEPSPILFGAFHLTLHNAFDMDEPFQYLVQTQASSAHMFRAFNEDPKHQRSFFFTFKYYTIIGEECKPMQWQRADKVASTSDEHIPLSQCAVFALVLFHDKPRRLRNRGRRAETKYGWTHDVWSHWQVLQLECFPNWKSTPANGTPYTFATGHRYLNGAEAFLHAQLTEYRDARKRYDEMYKRITELVTPPLGFLFDEELRNKRLFKDKDFIQIGRYFYAHQALGNVNDSIKSMINAFEDTFTEDVQDSQSKTLWPLFKESPRNNHQKRQLRLLRLQFKREMKELRIIQRGNNERRREIDTLQEQLFSRTSIQESQKSVELADVTVHQGYNIKFLTIKLVLHGYFIRTAASSQQSQSPTASHIRDLRLRHEKPARASFSFWPFGVTLAAICIPFFSIIGFLSTKYGYSIWAQKTKEFWRWIRPKTKSAVSNDTDLQQPINRANRTMSTEEGMRSRWKESRVGNNQPHLIA